jgi:beta-xylosidase
VLQLRDRGRGLLAAALTALLVAACAGPADQTGQPATTAGSTAAPSTSPGTAAPGTTAPGTPGASASAEPQSTDPAAASPSAPAEESPSASPLPSIDGPAYDNPVFASDFPDPHVILVDGTYYAYSTNSNGQNIPVISSDDLTSWERVRDALPVLPSWTALGFGSRWAPGVIQIDDQFLLYYVACDATVRDLGGRCPSDSTNRQCIGLAVAEAPEGPYRDDGEEPFLCQYELGGSIDAYPFRDVDGQLYLYWKNDGNCCGLTVGLWAQKLSDDGLELVGEPVELIQRDQIWEIPLIENPAMVENEGTYYLFYSGNWWESHQYAVGYAVCESATGPCEKPLDEPLFEFSQEVFGPGGQAMFEDEDGDVVMAYHAWTAPIVGYPQGQRSLRIDPVTFENGVPVITGPTSDPQPLP